ncbi:MAG: LD-carboxypeptidase [Bacteroidales bacterium]|nr:LD-carboxypeptidase [Bacteroidales bacterium]
MNSRIMEMRLHEGDSVALVATARKVSPVEVEPAVKLFESWGLRVIVPEGLYAADCQFAGSDRHRAAMLQELIDNHDIKAVFCVRGGYGTVRIIDSLDFASLDSFPKWIVGYSDVTALHSHMATHCSIPSLHATMPVNIPTDAVSKEYPAISSLHDFLFYGGLEYHFPVGTSSLPVCGRVGECRAPVVGGNLSVLYSLLGSDSDVDTDGKILLIEDLDEYLYHVDRMMMALKRAKKLDSLKGLIVGAFTDMHDNAVPFGRDAYRIVLDAVAEYDYPVAVGCPFGHIGMENLPLPLNAEVGLVVSENEISISL